MMILENRFKHKNKGQSFEIKINEPLPLFVRFVFEIGKDFTKQLCVNNKWRQ